MALLEAAKKALEKLEKQRAREKNPKLCTKLDAMIATYKQMVIEYEQRARKTN